MELLLCFALAVSAFVAVIAFMVGLFSAPTPVLLAILVAGMLLTQKSINKLKLPEVNLENKDKNRLENVQLAVNSDDEIVRENKQTQEKKQKDLTSMSYRGFNYMRSPKLEKSISIKKNKPNLQYRGIKAKNIDVDNA